MPELPPEPPLPELEEGENEEEEDMWWPLGGLVGQWCLVHLVGSDMAGGAW